MKDSDAAGIGESPAAPPRAHRETRAVARKVHRPTEVIAVGLAVDVCPHLFPVGGLEKPRVAAGTVLINVKARADGETRAVFGQRDRPAETIAEGFAVDVRAALDPRRGLGVQIEHADVA